MFKKKLRAGNPCNMALLRRGGGHNAVVERLNGLRVDRLLKDNHDREPKNQIMNRLDRRCHSGLDPESYRCCILPVFVSKILNQVQDDRKGNNSGRRPHKGLIALFTYCPIALRNAFTMAEILLSLTIIGVVAAITLPSLTGNINERTWNTQRKALFSRMSQAISLMSALNNYGTLTDTTDTAAENFITSGLSKVLKINNICDNDHLEDCGIVTSFTNLAQEKMSTPTTLYSLNGWFSSITYNGDSYSTKDTKAVAFETQNGENIIAYYNRSCKSEYLNEVKISSAGNSYGFPQSNMCLNFIYDLNGKKGPNTIGKDMGVITVFNATDSVAVAPMPLPKNAKDSESIQFSDAAGICKEQDSDSRVPNINELCAMVINKDILNLASTDGFLSSTSVKLTGYKIYWRASSNLGIRVTGGWTDRGKLRCIKR